MTLHKTALELVAFCENEVNDPDVEFFLTRTINEMMNYLEQREEDIPGVPGPAIIRDFGKWISDGVVEDEAIPQQRKLPIWAYRKGETLAFYERQKEEWHPGGKFIGRGRVKFVDGCPVNVVEVSSAKTGEVHVVITEAADTFTCLKNAVDEMMENERQEVCGMTLMETIDNFKDNIGFHLRRKTLSDECREFVGTVLNKLEEYAAEAGHQEGEEYWDEVAEALAVDFGRYLISSIENQDEED